jgi:putative oxidoreductase
VTARDAFTTGPAITRHTEADRLIFPGLQGFYDALAPYMYPLFRFAVGAMVIPHGYMKFMGGAEKVAPGMARLGFEPAILFAYFIIFLEMIGGACVAVGLFTRVIAAALAIEFAVITFGVHLPLGWFVAQRGGEYPLMWGIFLFCVALRGGGNLSVDKAIGKEV